MLPFIAVTKPAENHCCEMSTFKKRKKRGKRKKVCTEGGGKRIDLGEKKARTDCLEKRDRQRRDTEIELDKSRL